MTTDMARRTRDVTGPTGYVFSNAWDKLEEHGDAYMKSFDRRVPPSLFISERDRLRHGQPMPIVERCLEDHGPPRTESADLGADDQQGVGKRADSRP